MARLNRLAAESSPRHFRQRLRLDPRSPTRFADLIQLWQEADFAALDPAWLRIAARVPVETPQPLRRAWIERPRGHAKTADMAVQIAWILLFARYRVLGLAAAADRDQATLIQTSVQRLTETNPTLCRGLLFRQHTIVNPLTGSELQVISSDVNSSWGALPDFVICDELCHWDQPDLWQSLFSSAAKRDSCLLAVLTNAGVGRGWQWELREAARHSPDWHFSTLAGSQAPWITPQALQEQRDLLPPAVYARLWENIWQEAGSEFVSLAEASACCDPKLLPQDRSQPGRRYIAAIDYAEKHDYTAAVLLHREGTRLLVDRLDVVRPTPDRPTPVSWVRQWIERIAATFPGTVFVLDPYQLVGVIQDLEPLFDVRRFDFAGTRGHHALALNLRRLILNRDLTWYPGCGALTVPWGRDDLETELAAVLLRQAAGGRFRLDHRRDAMHHDDRVFALAVAALHAVQEGAPAGWMMVADPVADDFAW